MANKLGINKPRPVDLSSLSAYPSLYDRTVSRPSNLRKYSGSQREPAGRQSQPQSQIPQSHLYSASSQSQQSFSQGAIFSQPFSQLSQDDPATALEEWRCNREGRPFSGIPRSSETLRLEDSSRKLSLSKTSSLIQKLNSRALPEMNSHASEELEKKLEILDEGLSKVITMLDSVQGDLQKLSKAVQSASLESEGIKQKMILQESSLQLLLKEEEKVKAILTAGLSKLTKQNTDVSTLENLFNELQSIPAAMTRHLSMIKTDLFTCIRNELQTVRECIKSTRDDWTSVQAFSNASLYTAEIAPQKGGRSAGKKRTSSRVPAPRERQIRKAAPARKPLAKSAAAKPPTRQQIASGTVNSMQGCSWAPLSWNDKGSLDRGAITPVMQRAVGSKRGRPKASKKPEAATGMQTSDAIFTSTVPTNFPSRLPFISRAEESSAEKGCEAFRTTPAQAPQFNKKLIMNERVEKNCTDNFTFEMEDEVESFLVPEDTTSKTKHVMEHLYELHVEDEAEEIRKKMIKARRKRGRSTCVSLCD